MNQKRTTKQALLFSVLALALCFCMLIGSTFAWFTDSVSSDKNTIVAGNLDIALEYYKDGNWSTVEGATDLFDPAAKWEPGHAEVVYLNITNEGNLDLKYLLALNVLGEHQGLTKDGAAIKLSEHILYGLLEDAKPGDYATREDAIAAVTNPAKLSEVIDEHAGNVATLGGDLDADAAEGKYVALLVWMPTSVGNEANHDGVNVPSIDLGVTVVATQMASELDGFNNQYDAGATFPQFGTGVGVFTGSRYEAVVRTSQGNKLATAYTNSVATNEQFEITIEKLPEAVLDHADGNIVLSDGQNAQTFEISASGQAAGAEVEVWLNVEDSSEIIALYHNGVSIDFTRSGANHIIFKTTTFSPFTVVTGEREVVSTDEPSATVVYLPEFVGTELTWGNYGDLRPDLTVDPHPMLDAAYSFSLSESVEEAVNGPYADWYCDFYVKLDQDLGENQIMLAGNYGTFGWIGFHNGEYTLPANESVGLLATFLGTDESGWTYEMVADLVGEFKCGVGDVNDVLAGATFTVELIMTDPTDSTNKIVAATQAYTFQ